MARDWDEYYSDPANFECTPAPLLVETVDRLVPGKALDLAAGAGRNALYLAGLGWHVTAVDRSPVAIRRMREQAAGLSIDARTADLESGAFLILPAAYDLICDFFYLQRDLFPQIREGVRPGGVFIGTIHLFEEGSHHNPAFVLRPGELREEFAGWKILFYSEAARSGETRPAARIVARRA